LKKCIAREYYFFKKGRHVFINVKRTKIHQVLLNIGVKIMKEGLLTDLYEGFTLALAFLRATS
jgi:hypothetical protein